MAQKGIREFDAKNLMGKFLSDYIEGDFSYDGKVALVSPV